MAGGARLPHEPAVLDEDVGQRQREAADGAPWMQVRRGLDGQAEASERTFEGAALRTCDFANKRLGRSRGS